MSTVATLALTIMYFLEETHFWLVFILRIVVGFGHGALFPATYTIWMLWAVPHERGTLTALSFSGTHMGTCKPISFSVEYVLFLIFPATMMLLGGILCRYTTSGWMHIFILSSAFGLIWFFLWLWLVSDSPKSHRRISKNERDYICRHIDEKLVRKKGRSVSFCSLPWKNIFRSKPIVALFITHWCNVFGLFFFYTNIGKLLTEIHHVSTLNAGYILASGFIIMAICSLSSGKTYSSHKYSN